MFTLSSRASMVARYCRPAACTISVRHLNVHEYISMQLLKENGVTTPECHVATTSDQASHIFSNILNKPDTPSKDVVIKAQVLAGGRGRGTFETGLQGGVHVIHRPEDAKEYASQMLGNHLVTKQTQKSGIICNKVLLVEKIDIAREMYVSLLYDRERQGIIMIGSPSGGTSIEDVAKSNPELIFTEPIDIDVGLTKDQAQNMSTNLGFRKGTKAHDNAVDILMKMYSMFLARDCKQIEINPLVETPNGVVTCLDAKCNFDDNAQFRQPDIFAQRDYSQEDPCEADAEKFDLNYVGLDGGSIGCMVNGAGLAMATMDLIHLMGGEPAVFLDCGGGASEAQVQKAFEIMNTDAHVKAILVNIFGGIMRCDIIASGIIKAYKHIGLKKPVVLRLQGTKETEAKELLRNSDVPLTVIEDYEEAARKAIELALLAAESDEEEHTQTG